MRQWKRACVGWSCTCRVLTVAMLMRPSPSRDPPPTQTCRKRRTATVNSAKDRKAISWNKSGNSEAVLTKCFFGEAPGGCRLVWVSSHTAERWGWGVGGERERRGRGLPSRFHLHFRVGGQCDESRHHSLSDQRLIHPLHQQLIRLDKSQSRCHRGGRGIGTRASNTANT